MYEDLVLTGIVLSASLNGEYDKRLVVLTKECGKVTIFANGARKPKSTFAAASQPFVMGRFTVHQGRDAYTLRRVEVDRFFEGIPVDIEKMCYASYVCEVTSYYKREGEYSKDNLNLLYFTLQAIEKGELSLDVIKSVFEMRILTLEGEGANASVCAKCNTDENLSYIDYAKGRAFCKSCGGVEKGLYFSSPTSIYGLAYANSAPLNKLYNFVLKEDYESEFVRLCSGYFKHFNSCHFRSLEILETIKV